MKEHALRNPRGQRTVEGKGRINTTALRLLEHTRRENCRHSWPYLNNYKYIKSHLHRTPTNAPLSSTLSSIVVETKTYHHHVMSSARPPVHISRKFREPEKEKKKDYARKISHLGLARLPFFPGSFPPFSQNRNNRRVQPTTSCKKGGSTHKKGMRIEVVTMPAF